MLFFDPLTAKNGEPYGPYRYHQIVQESYFISKSMNTTYSDTLKMTPLEREYILRFISDEIKKTQEEVEKQKAQLQR